MSTEKSLRRDPSWEKTSYCDQINDMITRGVARKLPLAEVTCILHCPPVVKHDSQSTPVRIVFDSSHNYRGHCLHDYWMKGPDAYMNNLLNVLLNFRENSVGIVGDIRKMYNSVYIKNPDQHVHRFV